MMERHFEPLKRYLLFSGNDHNDPQGSLGWRAFQGSFATYEEVAGMMHRANNDNWWQVIDIEKNCIIVPAGDEYL